MESIAFAASSDVPFFSAGADTAPVKRPAPRREQGSIMDLLRKEKRFSKLVQVLEENRGLRDEFDRRGHKCTLFAPTNDAFNKMKEEFGKMTRGKEKPNMEEVLRYHVVDEEWTCDDMFDGLTIKTRLKVKELDNNPQRIRVFKFHGEYLLNMYARLEEDQMQSENGIVYAIDRVLCPPPNMAETLYYLPTKFSTFLAACYRSGSKVAEHLCHGKAMTVFVPPNYAWENLGFRNLMYLFSEEGKDDLKKVCEYHMCEHLLYADKLLKEKQVHLDSMLRGQRIMLEAKRRKGDEKKSWLGATDGALSGKEHECPGLFRIMVNEGEATVTFTDALAENGNMMLLSNVLIPNNVRLPEHRMN